MQFTKYVQRFKKITKDMIEKTNNKLTHNGELSTHNPHAGEARRLISRVKCAVTLLGNIKLAIEVCFFATDILLCRFL